MSDVPSPSAAPVPASTSRELLPEVYDDLRRLAHRLVNFRAEGKTLQATALVHEAFLRVCEGPGKHWDSRRHFFAATANAMRHVLVDHARRSSRIKHGGMLQRIELEDGLAIALPMDDELLALHEALERMQLEEPGLTEIVMLRYFSGLTMQEIAEMFGESERNVYRQWRRCRAWLSRDMSRTS